MARRVPMDSESAIATKERMRQASALAHAARMKARLRLESEAGEGDTEGDGGSEADIYAAMAMADEEARRMAAVPGMPGFGVSLTGSPVPSPRPTDRSSITDVTAVSGPADALAGTMPTPLTLPTAALNSTGERASHGSPLRTAAEAFAPQPAPAAAAADAAADADMGAPAAPAMPIIKLAAKDGKLHRMGSLRFKKSDYDNRKVMATGGIDALPALEEEEDDSDEAEASQESAPPVVAPIPSRPPIPKRVTDVHSFVAKHSVLDDAGEVESGGSSSPGMDMETALLSGLMSSRSISSDALRFGLQRGNSTALFALSQGDSTGRSTWRGGEARERHSSEATSSVVDDRMAAAVPASPADLLPNRLSKLDLYFRPMRQDDRIVMRLSSADAYTGGSPSRPPSSSPDGRNDALDGLIASTVLTPPAAAFPSPQLRLGTAASTARYSVSPSPGAAGSSSAGSPGGSPGITDVETMLDVRHRLGGRAGKLARVMSSKLRGQLSTAGLHLINEPESPSAGDGIVLAQLPWASGEQATDCSAPPSPARAAPAPPFLLEASGVMDPRRGANPHHSPTNMASVLPSSPLLPGGTTAFESDSPRDRTAAHARAAHRSPDAALTPTGPPISELPPITIDPMVSQHGDSCAVTLHA